MKQFLDILTHHTERRLDEIAKLGARGQCSRQSQLLQGGASEKSDVVMVPKLFHNSRWLWTLSQSKALGQVLGGVPGKVPVTFWEGSRGRSGKAAGKGSWGEVWGKL